MRALKVFKKNLFTFSCRIHTSWAEFTRIVHRIGIFQSLSVGISVLTVELVGSAHITDNWVSL
jgi:hypothetical protein